MNLRRRCLRNKFYLGDNLDILSGYINPDSVDLVYLDPPFNSKSDYFLFDSDGEKRKIFDDTLLDRENNIIDDVQYMGSKMHDGLNWFISASDDRMANYLIFLSARLIELHKVMKDTGVLFLHCDTNASHYIKVALDIIFGHKNYINSVTIKRATSHNDAKNKLGRVSDCLLIYGKTSKRRFHNQYVPYTDEYIKSKFRHVDDDGRKYGTESLTVSVDFNKAKPFGKFEWHGIMPQNRSEWMFSKENMDKKFEEGKIIFNSKGKPFLRYYLDEAKGRVLQDVWDDVASLTKDERCNYPTQKSLKLLRRVISLASDECDVVLDPFCGSGTTLVAAEEMGRNWIGIDNQRVALDRIKERIADNYLVLEI